jgi:hypothetical protein
MVSQSAAPIRKVTAAMVSALPATGVAAFVLYVLAMFGIVPTAIVAGAITSLITAALVIATAYLTPPKSIDAPIPDPAKS